MMDDLIEQVARFGPLAKAQIEEALAASTTGPPRVLEMTLKVSIPEATIRSVNDELARLTRPSGEIS
jgi:hypothetical protein